MSVLRSIYGRLIGLDRNDYLAGDFSGYRTNVTAYTSASSGPIAIPGTATLSSAAKTYTLDAPPAAGIIKRITTLTTSTLARAITRASTALYFQSTEGATMVTIAMAQGGASVTLLSASTDRWMVVGRTSTDTALSGTS